MNTALGSVAWRIKALIHILISPLPYNYRINYFIQNLRHAFSKANMLTGYRVQVKHIMGLNCRFSLEGKTVLEIGPGWYSIGATLFYLLGAKKIYLIDIRPVLSFNLTMRYVNLLAENYLEVAQDLRVDPETIIRKLNKLKQVTSRNEFLNLISAEYHAPGDAQKTTFPDHSIDLVFSYGVLEHIPFTILEGIMKESVRVLRPNGRHYHNIGLHDHFDSAGLGNGVYFLKYSPFMWKLIGGNDLAYHNRLRKSDYLKLMSRYGKITWQDDELLKKNIEALKRIKVSKEFRCYDATDLAYSALYVEVTI
ncbi:MAG TPA: class I SAM-dependent methyltransferase [Smithellaceae bacterium]|nr:class I SAM-dependent methyltransferase [Smithellaceae bacterium]